MVDWPSIINGAVAVGTFVAAGVALWIGLSQQHDNKEAIHNSQRPILAPAKDAFITVFEPGFLTTAAKQGQQDEFLKSVRAGMEDSPKFSFKHLTNVLTLCNVGSGVAMNIEGIITEPQPSEPSMTLAQSYRLILGVPLASGETKLIIAYQGKTMLHGTAEVIKGFSLYAPQVPSASDTLRGIGTVDFRLTFTCSDTFGRVHAFIYDFTESDKWVFRAAKVVEKSIDTLDQEATSNLIPGPSSVPISLQG